jgi:hypothetical protein
VSRVWSSELDGRKVLHRVRREARESHVCKL